jgi:hypothetical protein
MKAAELLEKLRDNVVDISFTDELTFSRRLIRATLKDSFYIDVERTTGVSPPKTGDNPRRVLKVWDTDKDCWVPVQLKYIISVDGHNVGKNGIVS